jgi:hypothetical protein
MIILEGFKDKGFHPCSTHDKKYQRYITDNYNLLNNVTRSMGIHVKMYNIEDMANASELLCKLMSPWTGLLSLFSHQIWQVGQDSTKRLMSINIRICTILVCLQKLV